MKASKLRTLMCGAFDAVSFSVGDIGSHWSNGLCCCDLVRDNYAADDSSGVFFSVRVEGCVSVRRITVGQGRGRCRD